MTAQLLIGFFIFAVANFAFLLVLSFMLWMAVDAAKSDKFWWIVLILGLPLAGAMIYFFVEKKHDYYKLEEKGEGEVSH